MISSKITKRNWKLPDNEKEITIRQNTSNYDKIFNKKNNNDKNDKEIKITEKDDKFLEDLEKKINEAEDFSNEFDKSILTKYEYKEMKENILYEKNINSLKILEKININNYQSYSKYIFNKLEEKIFLKKKKEKSKNNYFDKKKQKRIFKKIQEIKKSKRTLLLKKNSKDAIIDIVNLNKIYDSKKNNTFVLKDINLTINKGDFVILVGSSGSGKTTLMNIISGIDKLTYGEIIVNDINITNLKEYELTDFRLKNIGYIFQNYGLISNLNVEENISLGGYMSYLSKKEIKKIRYNDYFNKIETKKIIKILGLENIKDKMPFQLSGGQKQRVSIGRTLAKKPQIIFADEPTSALDEENSKNIIDILIKINKELKTTIIMITHNDKEVSFASKIIRMNNGKI